MELRAFDVSQLTVQALISLNCVLGVTPSEKHVYFRLVYDMLYSIARFNVHCHVRRTDDMAERTETVITDREISRLADVFPGYEYFKIADYFDTDRVTAMNINYNAR